MSKAKITLIGIHGFLEARGDDLFKQMKLPDGIDMVLVKNNILLELGEYEVLYANAYFLQNAINIWSLKYYKTFDKWQKALSIDYNPLENYNRVEEFEETSSNDTSSAGSISSTSKSSDDNTISNSKSAYNTSTYSPLDKTVSESSNDASANTSNSVDTLGTYEHTTKSSVSGNIGVTTSQEMLKQELDIASWNIIEQITRLFQREFVISVL